MYERAQGLITDARHRRCPRPFYTVISMWSGWFSAAMVRYLNQQTIVERRQTAKTWKALHYASMTPILRAFVKESLWLKLKTMERLHPCFREPMLCPICAVKETHEHVLSQCKYLCLAAKIVSQCFADVTVPDVLYTPFELLAAPPVSLLQSSLSVVLWAARWASWRVRCLVRVRRGSVLPHAMWSYFIGYWRHMLGLVSSMHEDLFGSHNIEYLHALESLDDTRTLKHPGILISLQPHLTKSQVKAQQRQSNKEERLHQQLPLIGWFLQQGYVAIYANGYSKHYDMIRWVGGFGICVHTEKPLIYAYPVPRECRQTSNGVELYAVCFVLTDIIPIVNHDRVLIVIDQEYVYKGALCGAQKWRRHGWRGASGLVADSGLWSKHVALIECV